MKAKEFLIERILNLHTPEQKAKYADEVWDLLQKSYVRSGGFKSAADKEELITIPGYWKIVKRGDKITAANLYRKVPQTQTFKVYASGAETTPDSITNAPRSTLQGKRDYSMVKKADVTQKRAWAEVSGPAEVVAKKSGGKPIPNKYAAYLTGKEILDLDSDGYHYTRLIQGEPYEKIMYGFIKLTPEQIKAMEMNGLDINDLPQ
jgi:hypothetical protein